ncbi:MAG: class I SAM-dependent methyltransferase [Candidatus Omnitrophota bacterium]
MGLKIMIKKKKKVKRDNFLALISEDSNKILDLGCNDGSLGDRLKSKGKTVVGIDMDKGSIDIAKGKLDEVYLGDLKDIDLPYQEGYFDCILCGDVLDCFKDPLSILNKYMLYLKDDGHIVASMANVRYYKVIIRLLFGGTWDYTDEGILWKHHVRFFTLVNMKELFMDAGCEIVRIERNISSARGFKIANFLLFGVLKDLLTYQYYIKAKKVKGKSLSLVKKRKIYKF